MLAKIRNSDAQIPAFLPNDDVAVTGTVLVTTVRASLE